MTTDILLESVQSSNIAAFGYDHHTQRLAVQFANGHIFYYVNVPMTIYIEMQKAPSKGSFYSREIKGHFLSEKMTGTCVCGHVGVVGERCDDCGTTRFSRVPQG